MFEQAVNQNRPIYYLLIVFYVLLSFTLFLNHNAIYNCANGENGPMNSNAQSTLINEEGKSTITKVNQCSTPLMGDIIKLNWLKTIILLLLIPGVFNKIIKIYKKYIDIENESPNQRLFKVGIVSMIITMLYILFTNQPYI